ncbi:MAG: response regulator [bacterium]
MNSNDEDFLKRLQVTFSIEAEEHIKKLSSCLIELENTSNPEKKSELIEVIFREAHSLKGAARSVNKKDVESLCQILESIFGEIKIGQISLNVLQFDIIHEAIDNLSALVLAGKIKTTKDNKELIKKLRSITEAEKLDKIIDKEIIIEKKTISDTESEVLTQIEHGFDTVLVDVEEPLHNETIRIPTEKLDAIFLQAEQMIQLKIAAEQRVAEQRTLNDFIDVWKKEFSGWNLPVFSKRDALLNEIIDRNNEKFNQFGAILKSFTHAIEYDRNALVRMIDEHVETMKSAVMLPVVTIIEGLPKFVRELARSQGKNAEIIITGKEVEVDKRILDEIKDPLIHLVRNCIDHGILKPDEFKHLNKLAKGEIILNFNVIENRHLEVVIFDNGVGIDPEKVRKAAVKSGLFTENFLNNLNPQEILMLIFQSGLSTNQIITDISGRGLGLAIVREKVEKLGGSVSVVSLPNIGTTFHLILPLTLATFRCVLIRIGEYLFAVPTVNVEHVTRVKREEIQTVGNKETLMKNGKILSLVNLGKVLGLPTEKINSSEIIQIIIIALADKCIAFMVDEILEEQQIIVKELGKQLSRVKNISGATVLGSGKVVPVINVFDLMKSAANLESNVKDTQEKEIKTIKKNKILVVDDSITSRTLIKNIIESADYFVETAVDGVDAFTKMLIGKFDLIVSDVDMPRMNGFELTLKIRNNKKLSELPVVLVTALELQEDRERGIEVGANAYIIKSSFDQSNLLEVIKQLL